MSEKAMVQVRVCATNRWVPRSMTASNQVVMEDSTSFSLPASFCCHSFPLESASLTRMLCSSFSRMVAVGLSRWSFTHASDTSS